MSTTKTLFIGLTAGAILGILFAPAKGSETRRNISDAGKDLRDTLDDIQKVFGTHQEEEESYMIIQDIRELSEDEQQDAVARSSWQD